MVTESHRDRETERKKPAEPAARNALVTANGIVLGFEIAFGIEWMSAEEVWELRDWWFGAPFLLSSILLTVALGTALLPYRQTIERYESSARLFIGGIVLAFVAIFLSVFT